MAERLKRRLELIEKERFLSSQLPRVRGGMIVIPRGLLAARLPAMASPNSFSEDPVARREIERKAMERVMAAERALGNQPEDVSAKKLGYDIASYAPRLIACALSRSRAGSMAPTR